MNAAYAQRLVTDENVQYFFLATYNFFSDPVEGKNKNNDFSNPYAMNNTPQHS
jgi:hypothetical protein